jgi:hypothetical protein
MDSNNTRNLTIDLITHYLHALKTGDFSDSLFTPDVTLFTPFMEAPVTGKEIVINALKEISKGVADIKTLRFVIEAEFACAIFEFKNKDGIIVNMCDAYRISNGMLAEMRPYFDPRPLI